LKPAPRRDRFNYAGQALHDRDVIALALLFLIAGNN
jgi:hypothetical protein